MDDVFNDPTGLLSDLITDDGSREAIGADLVFDFGREALLGGSFTLGYDEVKFSSTANPDLVETITNA